jgi:glucuronosyltransferase
MEALAVIMKDRPMSALDTALWWIEYVLRNPDTSSLKPLALNQAWYERRLLDVWGFLLGALLLAGLLKIYILVRIVQVCCKRNRDKGSPKKKVKKN